MAMTTNGTMNTTATPWGSAVDTSLQTDAQDAGDFAEADRLRQEQLRSLQADQSALTAPATPAATPAAPAMQNPAAPPLPIAPAPGASTQPVTPPTPSATPSAGQGGEVAAPVGPMGVQPLATADPLAFAPSPATSPGLGLSLDPGTSTPPAPTPTPAPSPTPTAAPATPAAPTPPPMTVDQATTAQDAANAAAHTTAPGTQTTDPYGHTASVNQSTSSNTYDAALAALQAAGVDPNDTKAKAAFWAAQGDPTTTAGLAWDGTPQSAAAQSALTASMTPEQIAADKAALTNAQSASNAAVANGFIDPAIRGQYFDATGNVLPTAGTTGPAAAPVIGASGIPIQQPTAGAIGANPNGTDPNGLPAAWETPIGFPGTGGATAGQGISESSPGNTPASGTGPVVSTTPPPTPAPSPAPSPAPAPAPLPVASAPSPAPSPAPSTSPTPAPAGSSNTAVPTGNSTTSPTPIASSPSSTPYANLQATTPANSLTNQTILPGQATDRVALAKQLSDLFDQQQQPYFQRDLRTATQNAAGRGQLGSGMLNSSLGDVTNRYSDQQRIADAQFMNAAETGSIDDAYKNLGILQQQQQFQQGQSDTAFTQNVQLQQLANSTQGQQFAEQMQAMGFNAQQIQQAFTNAFQVQQLSDSENQQSFWQALQQEIQGNQGDPASYYAWLAGQYANNNPIKTTA